MTIVRHHCASLLVVGLDLKPETVPTWVEKGAQVPDCTASLLEEGEEVGVHNFLWQLQQLLAEVH